MHSAARLTWPDKVKALPRTLDRFRAACVFFDIKYPTFLIASIDARKWTSWAALSAIASISEVVEYDLEEQDMVGAWQHSSERNEIRNNRTLAVLRAIAKSCGLPKSEKVAYLRFAKRNKPALAGADKGTPMKKIDEHKYECNDFSQSLDELAREGAQRMLMAALKAESDAYVQRFSDERDEQGRALVVRNGHAQSRNVTVGAGTIAIEAPRVNDKRVVNGEKQKFTSQILPPYLRRSKNVTELLPLLYLRGLSTGDFREALPVLLGENAAGLSPSAITRLCSEWTQEYQKWKQRSLKDREYVYIWADGVHFNVRLEDERVAVLVVVGVHIDGTKEVIAVEDGFRESKDSWLSLLRDLRDRGMNAPCLAIGDGALGFWAALREVFPGTNTQRCWVHKLVNVLDKLPKSVQNKAKSMLHEAMYAPTRKQAQEAMGRFAEKYGDKYPKAIESLDVKDEALLSFFDYPAAHWKHLRTTNPIESTFATVRLRTRVTKGPGSRSAGLAMVFKLLLAAEKRWQKVHKQALLPLVRAGVRFVDGEAVEYGGVVQVKGVVKAKRGAQDVGRVAA